MEEEPSLPDCACSIMELDAIVGKNLQQTLTYQVTEGTLENYLIGTSGFRDIRPYFLPRQGRIAEAEQFSHTCHRLGQPVKDPPEDEVLSDFSCMC